MPVWKNLTTILCAATLAAGLAACGGGGGGSGLPPDTEAMERATALRAAIEAARATGTDGGFDDTPFMVAPTVAATNDGTTVTVSVTETGAAGGGIARAVAIAGWRGARFESEAGMEKIVVNTDVGPPEEAAFTPENLNRLREVSGLAGETVPASGLAIETGWYPLIQSTSLDAAPAGGSITHTDLEFSGTFGGGAGLYRCSSGNCSVTLDDRGAPTAMGGAWTFAPDSTARVSIPDYDHLYFGWWLDEADDPWGFQTFAGAAGYASGSGTVEAAMEGTATYRGAAAGVWATVDVSGGRITAAESGEFTAQATLTANFFGAQDAGSVTGSIGSFRDGSGGPLAGWRVTLSEAMLTAGAASFAGDTDGAVGSDTVGGGSWEGRFHGTDGAETNPRPSHATGRFDLHFPGAHIAGAFGAGRE